MADGVGNVKINGKYYRIDIPSYRARDVVDFAPRASVPTGSVVMSDMSLYQPLYQTSWQHGLGFLWYSDAMGYMKTVGNIDTRQNGIAMMYTQWLSSDNNNNNKLGFVSFGGNLYSYGAAGVRKFNGTSWSQLSILDVTQGSTSTATAASVTTLSFTATVEQSNNPILLVIVYLKNNVTVSSITYNLVSMGAAVASSGTAPNVQVFMMKNPPVGTYSVAITLSSSSNIVAQAVPFYNVDQTTPLGTPSTNSVASGTSSSIVISSAVRKTVVDFIVLNSSASPTPTASDTLIMQTVQGAMSGSFCYQPGAASVTTGWTWTGATKAEQIAISINFSAEVAVNFMMAAGQYLFAFPAGARIMKSTDGTTWTDAGQSPGAADFLWAVIHNGYFYAGKNNSNQIHYGSQPDMSDMEGTTADPATIYAGVSNVPTIGAIVFAGNLYVSRGDGLWHIPATNIPVRVIDYSSEASSANLAGMASVNGYMIFPVRDQLIQWNGARTSNITPSAITDTYPYTTYGSFDNLLAVGSFLYFTAKTNETPYSEALLCWDGLSIHKLLDICTDGTVDTTALSYDSVNNRLWLHTYNPNTSSNHLDYYIQLNSNSSFPYSNFPTTGTHSLYTSRLDMGFRRITKSMPSILVEAENVTNLRTIKVYYQLDSDGVWILWGTIQNSGVTELTQPGGADSREFNHVQLRFDFATNDSAQTPILDSFTLRFIIRADLKKGFNFNIIAASNLESSPGVQDERTSKEIVNDLWDARNSKPSVEFIDFLGDVRKCYLTTIKEQPTFITETTESDELSDLEYWVNVNLVEV